MPGRLLSRLLLQVVFVLLAVGTLCFVMAESLPGDSAYRIAAGQTINRQINDGGNAKGGITLDASVSGTFFKGIPLVWDPPSTPWTPSSARSPTRGRSAATSSTARPSSCARSRATGWSPVARRARRMYPAALEGANSVVQPLSSLACGALLRC